MKGHRIIYYIIFIIILIAVSIFFINGGSKYMGVTSTDLSGENISGILLMEKFDKSEVEKIFGESTGKVEDKDSYTHLYHNNYFNVALRMNKGTDYITCVYAHVITVGDIIESKKGIDFSSTVTDVKQAYGDNFLFTNHPKSVKGPEEDVITYVDKNNKILLVFNFLKAENKVTLQSIKIEKF